MMVRGRESNWRPKPTASTRGLFFTTTGRSLRLASTLLSHAPSTRMGACNQPLTILRSNSNALTGKPASSGRGKSGFKLIMLRWFEHSQIYQPDRVLSATGAELGRPFEDVSFKASDGTQLNGWFFAANANSSRARLAVLLCHGNAGNI